MNLFVPKNKVFFTLFENLTETTLKMSDIFVNCISEKDLDKRSDMIKQIEDLEHVNDEFTHQIFLELGRNFITPLDREDIHRLISTMDDMLDLAEDVAETINLYDIRSMTQEARQLADICVACSERVKAAVGMLSNMKNAQALLKITAEIDRLESDADHVMRSAMAKLFREESDVKNIIKMKAIYELLETITDKAEDVANVIQGLVLENA